MLERLLNLSKPSYLCSLMHDVDVLETFCNSKRQTLLAKYAVIHQFFLPPYVRTHYKRYTSLQDTTKRSLFMSQHNSSININHFQFTLTPYPLPYPPSLPSHSQTTIAVALAYIVYYLHQTNLQTWPETLNSSLSNTSIQNNSIHFYSTLVSLIINLYLY